jgi:hypothetical protein
MEIVRGYSSTKPRPHPAPMSIPRASAACDYFGSCPRDTLERRAEFHGGRPIGPSGWRCRQSSAPGARANGCRTPHSRLNRLESGQRPSIMDGGDRPISHGPKEALRATVHSCLRGCVAMGAGCPWGGTRSARPSHRGQSVGGSREPRVGIARAHRLGSFELVDPA